jgi:uncharacterized repeat protein (TIGR01451 family)
LSGPVILDDDLTINEVCPDLTTNGDNDNFFDPSEQVVCTASYTTTATDVSNGSITNTAFATVDGVNSPIDSVTVTTPIAADLRITKSDDADPVAVGATVTYTLTVTNDGPDTANNVTVTDTFCGAAFSVTSVTASQGGCVAFPCNLGSLANAASATITVVGTADASGSISNQVSVSADEADPDPADNTASETTAVNPSADLSITKSDDADPVAVGATVTYTLTVTNDGPDTANNVTVTDSFSGAACRRPKSTACPIRPFLTVWETWTSSHGTWPWNGPSSAVRQSPARRMPRPVPHRIT